MNGVFVSQGTSGKDPFRRVRSESAAVYFRAAAAMRLRGTCAVLIAMVRGLEGDNSPKQLREIVLYGLAGLQRGDVN